MTAWIASSPETMESPVVGESSPSSSLQEESAAAIPGSSPSNTTSPTEVEIPEVPKLMEPLEGGPGSNQIGAVKQSKIYAQLSICFYQHIIVLASLSALETLFSRFGKQLPVPNLLGLVTIHQDKDLKQLAENPETFGILLNSFKQLDINSCTCSMKAASEGEEPSLCYTMFRAAFAKCAPCPAERVNAKATLNCRIVVTYRQFFTEVAQTQQ
ncbi:hypothetical protein Pelo_10774 [Pelomyxa schiedti]|nr:hypothetical protein Pelo_10774 [Pelomyxa schiedti]